MATDVILRVCVCVSSNYLYACLQAVLIAVSYVQLTGTLRTLADPCGALPLHNEISVLLSSQASDVVAIISKNYITRCVFTSAADNNQVHAGNNKCVSKKGHDFAFPGVIAPKISKYLSVILATPRANFHADRQSLGRENRDRTNKPTVNLVSDAPMLRMDV